MIGVITVLARLVGFGRQVVFAHTVGTTCLGTAYTTANMVPNIIYDIVLGGALSSVVVPVLAGPARDAAHAAGGLAADSARQISSALLTWTVLLLVPVSAALALAAHPIVTRAALARLRLPARGAGRRRRPDADRVRAAGAAVRARGRAVRDPAVPPAVRRPGARAAAVLAGRGRRVRRVRRDRRRVRVRNRLHELPPRRSTCCRAGPRSACSRWWRPRSSRPGGCAWGCGPCCGSRPGSAPGCGGWRWPGCSRSSRRTPRSPSSSCWPTGTARPARWCIYGFAWAVFIVPFAVLAVPIATSAFPALSAGADARPGRRRRRRRRRRWRGGARRFDETAATSTRAVLLASWLGAAALVGARLPLARVFESHAARGASVLALALAAFAPGLVGYGLSANLSRVLYARGRNRATALAISGGWLLVIVADLVIVPFVAPPARGARARPRHVVRADRLGHGAAGPGQARPGRAGAARGVAGVPGRAGGRGGRRGRRARCWPWRCRRPGSSSTSGSRCWSRSWSSPCSPPSRPASTAATSEPRWPASVPAPASPPRLPPTPGVAGPGRPGRSPRGRAWWSGRPRAGPGRTSGCSRPGFAGRGIGVSVLGPSSAEAAFGFGALAGVTFSPVEFGDRPRPGDAAVSAAAAARPRAVPPASVLGVGAFGSAALARRGARARAAGGRAHRPRAGRRCRRLAGAARRPALVVTVHNAPPAGGGARLLIYRLLERVVARGADLVLCVSPDLEARMRAAARGSAGRSCRRGPAPAGRQSPPSPAAQATPRPIGRRSCDVRWSSRRAGWPRRRASARCSRRRRTGGTSTRRRCWRSRATGRWPANCGRGPRRSASTRRSSGTVTTCRPCSPPRRCSCCRAGGRASR